MRRNDLIGIVEACYRLDTSEEEWLQEVAEALESVIRPEFGLLAYYMSDSSRGPRFTNPVFAGADSSLNMLDRLKSMAALLDGRDVRRKGVLKWAQLKLYRQVAKVVMNAPASAVTLADVPRVGPKWLYTLGAPVSDVYCLLSRDIDGPAVAFMGGLGTVRKFSASERRSFQMLSAHVKAGRRLRQRIRGRSVSELLDSAEDSPTEQTDAHVLTSGSDLQDALGAHQETIKTAQMRRNGRDVEALTAWTTLVQGYWTVVQHADTDGKKFVVAHRNPEHARDPRGLTQMETRVAGLAVRGFSDKLIAYHLGVASNTVTTHLRRSAQKLRLGSRTALIRHLQPWFSVSVDQPEHDWRWLGDDTAMRVLNTEARISRHELSAAEEDVLERLLEGASYNEIADARRTALGTVRKQVESLYRKVGVRSRAELAAVAGGTSGGPPDTEI